MTESDNKSKQNLDPNISSCISAINTLNNKQNNLEIKLTKLNDKIDGLHANEQDARSELYKSFRSDIDRCTKASRTVIGLDRRQGA